MFICFLVLAGDELWFRFKCRGMVWTSRDGLWELKRKNTWFFGILIFFPLKICRCQPVPATACPFCSCSVLLPQQQIQRALLTSWQEGWRGKRKIALAFGKGGGNTKKWGRKKKKSQACLAICCVRLMQPVWGHSEDGLGVPQVSCPPHRSSSRVGEGRR